MWTKWVLGLMVSSLVACSSMNPLGVQTTKYAAALCGSGAVTVPCHTLGTLDVPDGSLVSIVVAIVAPELTKATQLKNCKFTVYPEGLTGETITVTASAVCLLNGVEVPESLQLTLTPAA